MRIGIGIGLCFRRAPIVAGGGDVTAPTLVGNPTINAAGTEITFTFSEAPDPGSVPAAGAFALGGTARTVASVLVAGLTVVGTLSGVIGTGVVVTASYTAGASPIQDAAGNDVANFAAHAVDNNSTQDVTAPTFVSAVVNAAGNVVLTFADASGALDPASVPTLTVNGTLLAAPSGAAVVSGLTVTQAMSPGVVVGEAGITVTTSGAPIRDAAGNNATALAAQAVTNNSARAARPDDVSGLVFWGDMNDPATYTEAAGAMTSRLNKVSGVALTLVGSPTYQATGLNGRPTCDYSGTTQGFRTTEAAVVAAGINPGSRTVFVVGSLDDTDALEDLIGWNQASTANGVLSLGQSTTGTGRARVAVVSNGGSGLNIDGVIAIDTTAHIYSWESPTTTTISSKIDSTADIPSTALASGITPDQFSIGASIRSGVPSIDAQLSEELVYNRKLTVAEESYVRVSYLKTKWGTP